MKIERLLSIVILLLDKKIISASQLAQQFEVSKRTIYRDIETLEISGFPIISFPGTNGGFGLIDSFKMNRFTFSDYEKQKIIDSLILQEQLLPFQEANPIINSKLQTMFNDPSKRINLSLSSATLHNPLIEAQTNQKLKNLYPALVEHLKVRITYVTSNGEFSKRIILPLELTLQNGSWYLYAFCELRQDLRLFKITRIRKLTVMDFTFAMEVPPKKALSNTETKICLSFHKRMLGKLYDFFLDEHLSIMGDTVLVEFSYNLHQNIMPFLLMFSDQVQVISPLFLKQTHQEIIEKMQNIYKNKE